MTDRLVFDLARITSAQQELGTQADGIQERIDQIVNRVEIKGMNILGPLLGLTHDRRELETLGKAVLRIAPLVTELDELRRREGFLNLTKENPLFFTWVFGETPDDSDFTTFLKDDND